MNKLNILCILRLMLMIVIFPFSHTILTAQEINSDKLQTPIFYWDRMEFVKTKEKTSQMTDAGVIGFTTMFGVAFVAGSLGAAIQGLNGEDNSISSLAWGFAIGAPIGSSILGSIWAHGDLGTLRKGLVFTGAEMAIIQSLYFLSKGKVEADIELATYNMLAGLILLPVTTIFIVKDYRARNAAIEDNNKLLFGNRKFTLPYGDRCLMQIEHFS